MFNKYINSMQSAICCAADGKAACIHFSVHVSMLVLGGVVNREQYLCKRSDSL